MQRQNVEHETCSMKTPLIQNCREKEEGLGERGISREDIVEEVKKQLWLAGPLVCVNLLQFCLQLISLMFVGHMGKLALSAASMATSFASVTGFSLLKGMSTALDTISGQSYGAKQYHMLGIQMQRAMVVQILVSVPVTLILANTGNLLRLLGQDPSISAAAGVYSRIMIPSVFAYGLLQCVVRFLQAQNDVFPMMLTSGITTIFHIIICWILVFKSGMGYRGAALANAISNWVNFFLLVLYVKFSSSCRRTWTGFSMEAFHYVPSYLKLAIPSAIMMCLENWSFEMMVLLSGLLPNPVLETSVLSICLNTTATVFMIPYGLSAAISTRVSNELGAGHPKTARLAVLVVLVIAIAEGIFIGLVLILIRNIWGHAYSNDKQVIKYVASMLPLIALSNLIDGLQCVLSGTVRGCGRQKIGAYINLGSYYLAGIPASIVLAFVFHFGGKGLWSGIIIALLVQGLSLLIIIIPTNWEHETKKAMERVFDSIISVEIVS